VLCYLSFLKFFEAALLFTPLSAWAQASTSYRCYYNLGHDNKKVGLLQAQLLDEIIIAGSLPLEDNFLRFCRDGFLDLYLLLQVGDLSISGRTVWVGSISMLKISPLRFLILIFIGL